MLIVAAGVVADCELQPRVRRRVWREPQGDQGLSLRARTPASASSWCSPAAANPYLGGEAVKRTRERVAGLDVHRDTVVACCQVKQPDRSVEVTADADSCPTNAPQLASQGHAGTVACSNCREYAFCHSCLPQVLRSRVGGLPCPSLSTESNERGLHVAWCRCVREWLVNGAGYTLELVTPPA
jgi:hypothetical protein